MSSISASLWDSRRRFVSFAPEVGGGSAEPRAELSSSLGPAPVVFKAGIAAGTFPTIDFHLLRVI
jgi:hypothetical protein